jgi:orotate phosphoribosyltransferase
VSASNTPALARAIYERAHLTGDFRLRSGATSRQYFDKYMFEADPKLAMAIAERLAELVPDDAEALAGLELGGVPLATLTSQVTGLPTLFVRKAAKDYGTCRLAEGGDVAGRRLVVIEDVVTSGGQIIESTEALRALGARVATALYVIDREAGGVEKLAASGLDLRALFKMSDLLAAAPRDT